MYLISLKVWYVSFTCTDLSEWRKEDYILKRSTCYKFNTKLDERFCIYTSPLKIWRIMPDCFHCVMKIYYFISYFLYFHQYNLISAEDSALLVGRDVTATWSYFWLCWPAILRESCVRDVRETGLVLMSCERDEWWKCQRAHVFSLALA